MSIVVRGVTSNLLLPYRQHIYHLGPVPFADHELSGAGATSQSQVITGGRWSLAGQCGSCDAVSRIFTRLEGKMRALYLLLAIQLYPVAPKPSTYKLQPVKHSLFTTHANALPVPTIEVSHKNVRKKKGPNIPLSIPVSHHILVQNLHVIPIQHHIHELNHIIDDNKISHNVHNKNNTHTLIPILIPFHNLVPVSDLTVIPLHRVDTKIYNDNDERDQYRNPLGGYGAGWGYGGHGAGHGFHFSYG